MFTPLDPSTLIILQNQLNKAVGRLHDDPAKNDGNVTVSADTFGALLQAVKEAENKLGNGDILENVECPKCAHCFDHEVVA